MANASKLIVTGIILIAVAWLCDAIVLQLYPTFLNEDIGGTVVLILLLPVLGHFVQFSGETWKIVRVVTVLLAVPIGLRGMPPIMDIPIDWEWNILLGALHYSILIASFAVTFLLIRVEAVKATKSCD